MQAMEPDREAEATLRKHYLLFAHDQPEHVARLVGRLDDGQSTFWLHLDARSEISLWKSVVDLDPVVLVEPRVRVIWGTWSLVEAMLAMVRACLDSGSPGYVVMISGQSYPVKSTAFIDTYLAQHRQLLHMDLWELADHWPHNYRNRLDYFCVPLSDTKGDLGLLRRRQDMNLRELLGWSRSLARRLGFRQALATMRLIGKPRPDVADRVIGGSMWWAMPWEVLETLMEHHARHPEYAEFLRWSQFADEAFFQTLLVTLDPDIRTRIAPTLTHVDWTEGDWDLPRTMGADDVPGLMALPDHVIFARKFLEPASSDARAAVDEALAEKGW